MLLTGRPRHPAAQEVAGPQADRTQHPGHPLLPAALDRPARVPGQLRSAVAVAVVLAHPLVADMADVTGIVAASAFVAGTLVAFGRRRKILAEYHRQMEAKREELVAAIEQQLQHAIDLFYAEIGSVFQPLRAFCTAERKRYDPLLNRVREIEKSFGELTAELKRHQ